MRPRKDTAGRKATPRLRVFERRGLVAIALHRLAGVTRTTGGPYPITVSRRNRNLVIAKAVALIGSGLWLSITFPDYALCTLIVLAALALDSVVAPSFRPVLWSFIGSVVAYLAMTIAFYVRQFAFSYHVPHLRQRLIIGHFIFHFTAVFAPVMILIKFYRPGGRRLAFAAVCVLGSGGLGWHSHGRSTNWQDTLWMEYSSTTWGCCIGAVVATLIIGAYDFIQRPDTLPSHGIR